MYFKYVYAPFWAAGFTRLKQNDRSTQGIH